MKALGLVLCLMLFAFASCTKEDVVMPDTRMQPDQEVLVRKAPKPVPLKVHFYTVLNEEGMPGDPNGWVGGQATHFGNLQVENSPYWYMGPPEPSGNPDFPLMVGIFNVLTAANGDVAVAIGHLQLNPMNGLFIGHMEIVPHDLNTGKFVAAEGYAEITVDNPGTNNPETGQSEWEAEGEILFQ